ncbi:hypothetical protein FKP32DRAFT_1568786, partial [Trametes sanguinea]
MADANHLGRCKWPEWKKRVRALCQIKGALGHLSGTSQRPNYVPGGPAALTAEQQAALDKWDERENYVRFLLQFNTTSEASAGIEMEEASAAAIWAQLLTRYD